METISGQDRYTQEAVEQEINENFKDNKDFWITARLLRDTIKDVVASLWRKNYTVKQKDVKNGLYYKNKETQATGNIPQFAWIKVPKSNVVYIPENLIVSESGGNNYDDTMLTRIEMDNIENGHMITLMCKCCIRGLNTTLSETKAGLMQGSYISPYPSWKIISLNNDTTESADFFLDEECTTKVDNFSNFGWPAYYGGEPYHKRYLNTDPLQLIYWDGYWYPVNIY